jgi:hypothetical protein
VKKNSILLIRIKKEIEAEINGIDRLLQEYRELPRDQGIYLLRAKGSIFHDFYSAAERIFQKIGEELNGGIPKSEQWHKDLLFDMTLELETVRPRVLSEKIHERMQVFLRFRHLFRNVYGYELRQEKIVQLDEQFEDTLTDFVKEIETFLDWLKEQGHP